MTLASHYSNILFLIVIAISLSSANEFNAPILNYTVPPDPCRIPGSRLYTETWYTIDMKDYAPGMVVWTELENSYIDGKATRWKLQHLSQLDKESREKLTQDGSGKWKFSTTRYEPGWYKLKNAALNMPGKLFSPPYVTFSRTTDTSDTSNYLLVMTDRSERDYLIKPLMTKMQQDGNDHYQLKIRNWPQGKIAWSRDKDYDYSHFIKIYHGGADDMERFGKGNKSYDSTLFYFKSVPKITKKYGRCPAGQDDKNDIQDDGKGNIPTGFGTMIAILGVMVLLLQ